MSYMIQNGRINRGSNGNNSSNSKICWFRVIVLVVVASILAITNPGNDITFHNMKNRIQTTVHLFFPSSSTPSSPSSQQYRQHRRMTNYGFFSIEEKIGSVNILAMNQSWNCPSSASSPYSYAQSDIDTMLSSFLCDLIGDNMTHQKPLFWDEHDRVHTTHRLICFLLIFSTAYSFCCPRNRYQITTPWWVSYGRNNYISTILSNIVGWCFCSIFATNAFDNLFLSLLMNLLHMNTCVYPTLLEMNRVVPRIESSSSSFATSITSSLSSLFGGGDGTGSTSSNGVTIKYIVAVSWLLFGIGGGTNYIISKVFSMRRRSGGGGYYLSSSNNYYHVGIHAVVAASLAYYQQVTAYQKRALFYIFSDSQQYQEQPITAGMIFWTLLFLTVFSPYSTSRHRSSSYSWLPSFLAWSIAGCGGSILGQYHMENQVWWSGIVDTFRWL